MTSFIYDDRSVKLGTPIYSLPESSYRIVSLISAAYRVFLFYILLVKILQLYIATPISKV